MEGKVKWEVRRVKCPEEGCAAGVMLEWEETQDRVNLRGVHCGHARLKDLDNWECHWSCWEELAAQK